MHLLCARHNFRHRDTSGNDLFGDEADLARSLFSWKQRPVRCLVWAPWVLVLKVPSASLILNLQECGVSSWIKDTVRPVRAECPGLCPKPRSWQLSFHCVYFCSVPFTGESQVDASSVPSAEQGKGPRGAHWWDRQCQGSSHRVAEEGRARLPWV